MTTSPCRPGRRKPNKNENEKNIVSFQVNILKMSWHHFRNWILIVNFFWVVNSWFYDNKIFLYIANALNTFWFLDQSGPWHWAPTAAKNLNFIVLNFPMPSHQNLCVNQMLKLCLLKTRSSTFYFHEGKPNLRNGTEVLQKFVFSITFTFLFLPIEIIIF